MKTRKHLEWENEFEDLVPSKRRLAGISYRVEALRVKRQLRKLSI